MSSRSPACAISNRRLSYQAIPPHYLDVPEIEHVSVSADDALFADIKILEVNIINATEL